jgi:hypothetical protein
LGIGSANAGATYKTKLFPDHEEFCANEVDITVRGIRVLDGLYDEGICGRDSSPAGPSP